ncbi:MAG: RsiV family protein [Muribaculaceae bacterium]
MKKCLNVILVFVAIMLAMSACKNVASVGSMFSDADTVAIASVAKSDTSWFALTTGGRCDVDANVNINYPAGYKDAESTQKLQHMFVQYVLELADSVGFDESPEQYLRGMLSQYGISSDEKAEHVEDDYVSVYRYSNSTDIGVVFNRGNILSFCRSEVIKKNDKVTMSTHRYVNFDLKNMSLIDVSNLFNESVLDNVATLLKEKLKKQNGVDSDDALIDLGYFNLDNLRVTNNFYIKDESVVWSFVPYEISLYSVGETEIELTFDEMSMYLNDNSPVSYIN